MTNQHNPRIVVIDDDDSVALSSIEAGALEIITKPVEGNQLIEKIEAAIN